MFPQINPANTKSWKSLTLHFEKLQKEVMTHLFASDPLRFEKYSLMSGDIFFDFSKNRITGETMDLLFSLYRECAVPEAIEAMFTGATINKTENRPVLHTALRSMHDQSLQVDGKDIMPSIRAVLDKMQHLARSIHDGEWKGFSGKKIRNIVNIGIGGSDLGPVMVTEALRPYHQQDIRSYFVSNVDPAHISSVLREIQPEETIFIIASKTFTTQETMANAQKAKEWFLQGGGSKASIASHFLAVSTNEAEAGRFGIPRENMFPMWDWVGGRYSLWGAIGLSIVLTIGYDHFYQLLQGAFEADEHFRRQPPEKNIPVIMALLGIWYRNFFGCETEAVLPYDQHLHRLAAYFQQAGMESNGKSAGRDGRPVNYGTGPVIWGEPGTNSQHSFFQLLHQGTIPVPCDFIASAVNHYPAGNQHDMLISNFIAQTEALMIGRAHEDLNRHFPGNRPSNTILVRKMDPFTLGKLIAFYEHKFFVQGVIWNIYSFDQWGVELGKQLAMKILPELSAEDKVMTHDTSTNGLINLYKKWKDS